MSFNSRRLEQIALMRVMRAQSVGEEKTREWVSAKRFGQAARNNGVIQISQLMHRASTEVQFAEALDHDFPTENIF